MNRDQIDITTDDVLARSFENLTPRMMTSQSHLLVENDVPGSPLPLRQSKITSNSELDLGQVDSKEYTWKKGDYKGGKKNTLYKNILIIFILFIVVGLIFGSGLLVGVYGIGSGGENMQPESAGSSGAVNSFSAFTSLSASSSACGDCTGCFWTAANACYDSWEKDTCEIYTKDGYVWCAGATVVEEDVVVVEEDQAQDDDTTENGTDQCIEEVETVIVTDVVTKTDFVTTTLSYTGTSSPSSTGTSTTIPTATSDPSNNEITGFEKTVTPQDILMMFSDWGLTYPIGEQSGEPAAVTLHQHIIDAINLKFALFKDFCNSGDPDANKREAAAFFANIRKETGGFASLEEQGTVSGQYCSSNPISGASEQLKAAGIPYPCAETKKYHGRGAIQLTWNFNYGRFSEFMYGDKTVLLQEPELVKPDGPLGWAAVLWFWMTPQGYGGQCPPKQLDSFLEVGTESCHDAMHTGAGMGKTINIINGGYECCSTSPLRSSPIARLQTYLDFCGILGCERANKGCTIGDYKNCDISEECPLVSIKKDKGCDTTNTCTSSVKSLWVGSDNFQIERWACPSC